MAFYREHGLTNTLQMSSHIFLEMRKTVLMYVVREASIYFYQVLLSPVCSWKTVLINIFPVCNLLIIFYPDLLCAGSLSLQAFEGSWNTLCEYTSWCILGSPDSRVSVASTILFL